MSIFLAGIKQLYDKNSSFVFATHCHEIIHLEEITSLKKLSLNHMEVYYDKEKDRLFYDRKLKKGVGSNMYGLEVCKSLHLPSAFLEKAYAIRGKYFPETKGALLAPSANAYNVHKIRGKCEMCLVEIGEETHHLQEQYLANSDGYIGEFHKNHPANLMSVCSKCHDLVHAPSLVGEKVVKRVVRKKTTKGYVLRTP
jgi:DNA mismatch repair protein MutS